MVKEKVQKYIQKHTQVEFYDNAAVFKVSATEIEHVVTELQSTSELSLKHITATDERAENGCFKIWYIFSVRKENAFIIPFIELKNVTEFPSLALRVHGAVYDERKIKTFFGLTPIGLYDLRSLILHENWPADVFPLRKDFDFKERPKTANDTYHFTKVNGDGIYEIPVGPIHAGIIEPGHFRFSMLGENIVQLEPRLGFVHKGSEKLFEVLPLIDKIKLSEKISGDSSFSHSLAFCQVLETLSDTSVPKRALYLRTIYAEMERVANHFGDIGAIMTDTGFNFGGAHGSRLREIMMQINERITGSRFLRGVNLIGGVTKDIDGQEKTKLLAEMDALHKDFSELIAVAENSSSLLGRLKGTGVIPAELAKDRGIVGVAARSIGIPTDARVDHPYAAYDEIQLSEIAIEADGDVYARFRVRVKEVFSSLTIIKCAVSKLPEGPISSAKHDAKFKRSSLALSVVEGWRGEIMYFVTTDSNGHISRVVPHDPSFVNWPILAEAGFGNVIPDFPLINKSFNLSYTGNDL